MRFVSMSGPFGVGSGKSGTPLSRTHCANARRAVLCCDVTLPPVNPGGSRFLHAPIAFFHAALFGSSDEPFTTASMVSAPDALGSGNPLTPLARMHSANFTALSCAETVVAPPPAAVLLPVPADPPPQPATMRASSARAAKGVSVLVMVSSPPIGAQL